MNRSIGLDELTQPMAAAELLRNAGLVIESATPTYVRHKPGATTIIAYEFKVASGPTWGYAQWCTSVDRADEIEAKGHAMRPRPAAYGSGLLRLAPNVVVHGFPNDARLRRLRWYSSGTKLKRSLALLTEPGERISGRRTTVEPLRYKPERRIVARVDLVTNTRRATTVVLRYTTQRQATRLAEKAAGLRRNGVRVPAPVAQLDDDHVAVDEFVRGRQLLDVVRDGRVDGAQLADALLQFHRTPPPPGTARRDPGGEFTKARAGLGGLAAWEPSLEAPAAHVSEALARAIPARSDPGVLVHGDLHTKNVIVDEGGTIFVDLERVAVGSPAIDLGVLRAHALALAIRRPNWSPNAAPHAETVVEQYRRSGSGVGTEHLGWHTAIGLVDQALLVARHLEPGWPISCRRLLVAALNQIGSEAHQPCL